MGLLIGASTLTIIEILDLIIYNFFLKFMDYKHRRKAVSVVVKPSSNPIDNTNFGVWKRGLKPITYIVVELNFVLCMRCIVYIS